MTPGLCIFKNICDKGLLPRQILSWAPLVCKKVTIVQITLKFIPSFTDQTHILLTHCIPVRLSQNSYIWYPRWRRHHVLIKYLQKYNFFVFVFNSTEVETAILKIFCVMIPSLVYTCRDFLNSLLHTHGLTTPNASPIEIHVKCLNSTGRIYFFCPSP